MVLSVVTDSVLAKRAYFLGMIDALLLIISMFIGIVIGIAKHNYSGSKFANNRAECISYPHYIDSQ